MTKMVAKGHKKALFDLKFYDQVNTGKIMLSQSVKLGPLSG